MWQICQSSYFSIMRKTVSASLSVCCHSSSYRYFKFDFKTLCTPVMPEYGFSCQHWCHSWRWKCVHCMSEMPRWGWVPLLTNLKLGYWSLWPRQYSVAVGSMWQEVYGGYGRHSSGPLTIGWEMGTAYRHLATCLRPSVAHDTVAVHPLQYNNQSGLETVFSVLYFSFRFSLSGFLRFHFRLH